MTNIFISGLPKKADEIELVKLFIPFARVNTVQIGCDKKTGKPKGYAFVELHDHAEALEAVANLDGTSFGDSIISVKVAEDKAQRNNKQAAPVDTNRYKKVERFSAGSPEKKKRPRLQR